MIVDGTAGKNIANWCYILGVVIDSEFKSQIVGQMIADSECQEAYVFFMRHLILSGNAIDNSNYPVQLTNAMVIPALWLTDEDPGFISAFNELLLLYRGQSTAFRCHWHLGKDVKKHFACIHADNSTVHTLWETVLYETTEEAFEEAFAKLLIVVQPYSGVHKYFLETLYPSRLRWGSICSHSV